MAKDLNKVQLTGRLGADPEPRYTPQGTAVTSFRVASNRSWKSADGEQHEEAEWFRIVAWNKLGEICAKYLTKGTRVYIEGRLQTQSWQDQEGQTRYTTEVIASDMIILDSRRDGLAELDVDDDDEPTPVAAPARQAAAPARPAAPARATASEPPIKVAQHAGRVKPQPSLGQRRGPKPLDDSDDLPF